MKRLVVCCDGTWQRLYGANLTNVALMARAVSPYDADGNSQIVFYSAGIGATLDRPRLWEGVTGADLDEHLLEAYLFLTLNYEPGDQLYLFGFSRGAYTVRTLAGLLRKCGVLRRQHADRARAALELYRNRKISADSDSAHAFRKAYAAAWPRIGERDARMHVTPEGGATWDLRIRFIGVWDTVGALGMPRLLPFIPRNKSYEFHDTALSRAVQYARHAVAIDERRASFAPTLWSNVEAVNPPGQKPRVLQTWFPGDHGAVGGCRAQRTLSNCSLLWVIDGAEEAGLKVSREPGSVISSCLTEIDPIEGPVVVKRGFSVTDVLGKVWRKGPDHYQDLHETARLRWIGNRDYRPRPMQAFHRQLRDFLHDSARQFAGHEPGAPPRTGRWAFTPAHRIAAE
ncbi:MAG: DUF2235 domain-containing protein [Hyphomonadaceae bacterium]|nr:DUF2235 domain-containing protein [Hyphomonadaceae bacterium]